MATRHAHARWNGTLKDGNGNMKLGSGACDVPFSFRSRFEDGDGTNPEELIGAAHAGCFSMALSKELADAGYPPESIETDAEVRLEQVGGAFAITRIELATQATVPGISEADFGRAAENAKKGCPVSKALSGVLIGLKTSLKS